MKKTIARDDMKKTGQLMKASVLSVLSAVPAAGFAATAESRPNIVFFEVDDLMYRFMGEKGLGFVKTPNIDSLAKNGIYFKNAVTQGMMCGPSRNSLITGLYPHNLGFYRNGQLRKLPKGIWSLPQGMKNAGYTTAWVGKCHVHPPSESRKIAISDAMEQDMGFDYCVASVGRVVLAKRILSGVNMDRDVYIKHLKEKGLLETYINDCKNKASATSLPIDDYLDGFYTNTAIDWLKNHNKKRPFFLWLNLSCPHGPYDVPQKYHDMYKDTEIPPPLTDSFGGEIPQGLLKDNKPASPKKLGDDRRGFAAAVSFTDDMLGRLLDELKAEGLYDNTVIVFFSDHGVFMGNHGRIHKASVFNEITNPSLIISYPAKFRKGVDEEHPVELTSLLPTLLDLANAPDADKKKPFGESLLPLLTGKGEYTTRYVFSEIEGFQSCFDGRYRYIANDEKPLLYDLKNDPGEMKNIAAQYPEIAQRMRAATDAWFKKTGAPLPASHLKDKKNLKKWERPNRG